MARRLNTKLTTTGIVNSHVEGSGEAATAEKPEFCMIVETSLELSSPE